MGRCLRELSEERNNNFDFIRLVAAILVVYDHAYPLIGIPNDPYVAITNNISFGTLAVYIFFIISGFLITKSWIAQPYIVQFFKKRFLRIFPGLFGAVLFSVFFIGPLTTVLPLKKYFTSGATYHFIYNSLLFSMQFTLPGVFASNPYPYSVDGSLWTLPYEFLLYIVIAILGTISVLRDRNRKIIVFGLLFLLLLDFHVFNETSYANLSILSVNLKSLIPDAIFFLSGSFLFLYRDKVFLSNKFASLLLMLYIISFRTSIASFMSYITLPYLVVYVGFADIPFLRNLTKHGDFSYGIYIYSFPIQQALMLFIGKYLNVFTFFISALSITLVFAFFSWKFIEYPALRLKSSGKLPRRRLSRNRIVSS